VIFARSERIASISSDYRRASPQPNVDHDFIQLRICITLLLFFVFFLILLHQREQFPWRRFPVILHSSLLLSKTTAAAFFADRELFFAVLFGVAHTVALPHFGQTEHDLLAYMAPLALSIPPCRPDAGFTCVVHHIAAIHDTLPSSGAYLQYLTGLPSGLCR
jgi:hypothetical protein